MIHVNTIGLIKEQERADSFTLIDLKRRQERVILPLGNLTANRFNAECNYMLM